MLSRVAVTLKVTPLMTLLRREVLSIYREILRTGRNWVSKSNSVQETERERKYILEEARTLFRKNKNIENESEIQNCISEADTRLAIALHYGNPYPRPVYVPPQYLVASQSKKWKTHEKQKKQSRPIYIKSLD